MIKCTVYKKNVRVKNEVAFFSDNFRFCFISLNMLNVGEFSRSWLSGTLFQFRKRKKNSSSCVYVLHKTPHKDVVVQWRQRNASKSALNVQSCCFAYLRPSPHKSGYFYYFFFYTERPSIYTKLVNPDAEIALFWNRSPERFKAPPTWMRIKSMRFPICPNSCGHNLNLLLFCRSLFFPRHRC